MQSSLTRVTLMDGRKILILKYKLLLTITATTKRDYLQCTRKRIFKKLRTIIVRSRQESMWAIIRLQTKCPLSAFQNGTQHGFRCRLGEAINYSFPEWSQIILLLLFPCNKPSQSSIDHCAARKKNQKYAC